MCFLQQACRTRAYVGCRRGVQIREKIHVLKLCACRASNRHSFAYPRKLALTFCDPIELLIVFPALSGSNIHLRHLPISISTRPTACRYTCNAAAAACHACMLSGNLSCGPSARCGSSPRASYTHSSGNACGNDGTAAERTKMTETAEEILVSVRTHDELSGRWIFCQSHAVACLANVRGEVSHMQSGILTRCRVQPGRRRGAAFAAPEHSQPRPRRAAKRLQHAHLGPPRGAAGAVSILRIDK